MKTLTIRQPWAWAITRPDITDPEERAAAIKVGQMKLIENRTWHTKFRGRFLIHAAQGMTRGEYNEASWMIGPLCGRIPPFEELQRGGIVGSVELVDSADDSRSPWYMGEGSKAFVLRDPKPITFVRCKGRLGFWDFPGGDQLESAR